MSSLVAPTSSSLPPLTPPGALAQTLDACLPAHPMRPASPPNDLSSQMDHGAGVLVSSATVSLRKESSSLNDPPGSPSRQQVLASSRRPSSADLRSPRGLRAGSPAAGHRLIPLLVRHLPFRPTCSPTSFARCSSSPRPRSHCQPAHRSTSTLRLTLGRFSNLVLASTPASCLGRYLQTGSWRRTG